MSTVPEYILIPLVLVVFALISAKGALLMVVQRLRMWLRRQRAESWALVDGRVETHDAQYLIRGRSRVYFEAAVGYSYQFQGEYYSGLRSLGTAGSVEDADTKAQVYPIGMPVKVRVNPHQPQESLLEEP